MSACFHPFEVFEERRREGAFVKGLFLEGAGCGNAWRETLLTSARNPIIPRTSAVF